MSKIFQPRIVYVINHAAFFVSHRLPIALGAKKAGFEVFLVSGKAGSRQMEDHALERLAETGVVHKNTIWSSSGLNPFVELFAIFQLIFYLCRIDPDIVHCASPKGVLYGGIASRICRIKGLVLSISGMGYAYTSSNRFSFWRGLLKFAYSYIARFAFNHKNVRVIVQTEDDKKTLIANGLIKQPRIDMIPGSGVDLRIYENFSELDKKQKVILPARMLKDKGVIEFVEAAKIVRLERPEWNFVLAGAAGYDNPSAIQEAELLRWQKSGLIQWLGHVHDMAPLFRDAAIVCLPSYREGIPKALLEAAAAGCAVITTDVPGCRQAIKRGVTGDLVPPRDPQALAYAILRLINDEYRRISYGAAGRQRALELFSVSNVVEKTIAIYKELIYGKS